MKENKEVQVCEVIISNQLLRGNGKNDPYRRVTQVFTKDGDLIAEKDEITFNSMDLVHFANHYAENTGCTLDDVNEWVNGLGK